MSYKNPIKENEYFLVYKNAKPTVFIVRTYNPENDSSNELIFGEFPTLRLVEQITRTRIISKLTPEKYPEYFI
jgi:hypothetical protein